MAQKPQTNKNSCSALLGDVRDTFRWAGSYLRSHTDIMPAADKIFSAIDEIRDEVRVVKERDPAATSDLEVLLL